MHDNSELIQELERRAAAKAKLERELKQLRRFKEYVVEDYPSLWETFEADDKGDQW